MPCKSIHLKKRGPRFFPHGSIKGGGRKRAGEFNSLDWERKKSASAQKGGGKHGKEKKSLFTSSSENQKTRGKLRGEKKGEGVRKKKLMRMPGKAHYKGEDRRLFSKGKKKDPSKEGKQ